MLEQFKSNYRLEFVSDNPNLLDVAEEVVLLSWPEFMLHDSIANKYWNRLYEDFPDYQFCLFDDDSNNVVASGNCIPLRYNSKPEDLPDEGWDWALQKGFDDFLIGNEPNSLCALSITIHPAYREKRISREMIKIMKEIGRLNNLDKLIAPVRPYLKSIYPLIPIDKYIKWEDENGLPFDPWMRVHFNDGGKIIKSCPKSMNISGTVTEWEEWTSQRFPESGTYTIYGALKPIEIDYEADRGVYIEPNVWMYHSIE